MAQNYEKKKTLKPCKVFTNKPQEEEKEEWNMVVLLPTSTTSRITIKYEFSTQSQKRLITARFHRPEIPDLGNDDPPSLSGGLSCHKHPPSHPRSIVCWTVGLILRLKTISI